MGALKRCSQNLGSSPKRKVWPFNLAAVLLLAFALSLSAPDPLTRGITAVSLSVSLAACYVSLRRRFNLLGVLFLIATLYFYGSILVFIFGAG